MKITSRRERSKSVCASFYMIDEVIDGWIQSVSITVHFIWLHDISTEYFVKSEMPVCYFPPLYTFAKVVFVQLDNFVLNNLTQGWTRLEYLFKQIIVTKTTTHCQPSIKIWWCKAAKTKCQFLQFLLYIFTTIQDIFSHTSYAITFLPFPLLFYRSSSYRNK